MRELRYVVCDVFTDRPLTGNQLAVFTNATGLDTDTMQALTREMAFSESVFVLPATKGGHAKIRIFTPTCEIPFAGHPALGAAFVIGASVQLVELRLEAAEAVVPVRLERDAGRLVFGWMRQPVPTIAPFSATGDLLRALGLQRSSLPVEIYDNGIRHVHVMLDRREDLQGVAPHGEELRALDVMTVSVVAGAEQQYETRVFCPRAGIVEDAATGSAAGPLALHLARHGRVPFGEEITVTQGIYIQRPSRLHARIVGNAAAVEYVEVGGSAVVVARGEFRL